MTVMVSYSIMDVAIHETNKLPHDWKISVVIVIIIYCSTHPPGWQND